MDGLSEADPPAEFDEFTLVLLIRPPDARELDDASAALLQRQHLGHLEMLRQQGSLLLSGPFEDQPDQTWRGLCLYRAPLEEARRLAESDPAVRRGRLSVLAFRWYTRKGALVISGNDAGQSV